MLMQLMQWLRRLCVFHCIMALGAPKQNAGRVFFLEARKRHVVSRGVIVRFVQERWGSNFGALSKADSHSIEDILGHDEKNRIFRPFYLFFVETCQQETDKKGKNSRLSAFYTKPSILVRGVVRAILIGTWI